MKICVIGTGTMGSGIVLAFAQAGYKVVMKGISEQELATGFKNIEKNLSKLVEKGKLTEDLKKEYISNITGTIDYELFSDATLVVEAVFEEMTLKHKIFGELDKICNPDTILASNTSSLSITEIAFRNRDKVFKRKIFRRGSARHFLHLPKCIFERRKESAYRLTLYRAPKACLAFLPSILRKLG